jgi:RHS repeat-associated protein
MMTKNGIQDSVAFTGKERDSETGYGYFGARYMDHELMTMWLSVDPLADKYPSISPYAYCNWNPVKLVDPDGEEIVNPPFDNQTKNEPVINIDGHNAIIQQADGTSRAYNLSDHKQMKDFVSDVNNLLTETGSITGFVGIAGEKSKSTFRLSNSKGKLDFKFYPNGWKGNQYVTPKAVSKLAKGFTFAGNTLGVLTSMCSFWEAGMANTSDKRTEKIIDGFAGLAALTFPPYGFAASMYYFGVKKNSEAIFENAKNDAIDHANMMQRGYPALRYGMR